MKKTYTKYFNFKGQQMNYFFKLYDNKSIARIDCCFDSEKKKYRIDYSFK